MGGSTCDIPVVICTPPWIINGRIFHTGSISFIWNSPTVTLANYIPNGYHHYLQMIFTNLYTQYIPIDFTQTSVVLSHLVVLSCPRQDQPPNPHPNSGWGSSCRWRQGFPKERNQTPTRCSNFSLSASPVIMIAQAYTHCFHVTSLQKFRWNRVYSTWPCVVFLQTWCSNHGIVMRMSHLDYWSYLPWAMAC